jgi:UDP-N-acetylglucosamine:LPS N-acetylglucosamine transferase
MSKRILFPYLSAGLGHLILAQSIAHYVRLMRPDWEIRIMDAARELDDGLLKKTFEDVWRSLLKMPPILSRFFFALERLFPSLVVALNHRSFRTAVPKAAAFLAAYRPDLIMSTHWACAHLFSMARADNPIPLFLIYGELGATYSVIKSGADLYFAPTPRIEEGLVKIGVPPDRIRPVPFVVDPHLMDNRVPRDELKRQLGIPADRLCVVLSLGGEGIGLSMRFIEEFVRQVEGASLVVLTGRNVKLLGELESRFKGDTVISLGYREDISGILSAADVLAGKSGTGYAMLAVKKGIPLIITHIGAPNEAENMRYIVENGYGWFCPRPRQFVQRLSIMARDRGSYSDVIERLRLVDRHNGAETIAAAIVETLT